MGMIPSDGIIDPDTGAVGTGYHALSRSMSSGDSRSCIRRQSDVPFLAPMPNYGMAPGDIYVSSRQRVAQWPTSG
jgi:hypothetical protein